MHFTGTDSLRFPEIPRNWKEQHKGFWGHSGLGLLALPSWFWLCSLSVWTPDKVVQVIRLQWAIPEWFNQNKPGSLSWSSSYFTLDVIMSMSWPHCVWWWCLVVCGFTMSVSLEVLWIQHFASVDCFPAKIFKAKHRCHQRQWNYFLLLLCHYFLCGAQPWTMDNMRCLQLLRELEKQDFDNRKSFWLLG